MISIIIPTYNCAQFISSAIKSILLQSFQNFELIIINDGSSDDTSDILKKYSDGRIKYFEKEHSGLGETIDYGVSKASYDLIARMDADDIAHPERIQKQYNFLLINNDIDILSNWYAVFKECKIQYIVKRSVYHIDIFKNLSLFSDICHPSVLIKKKAFKEMGGFKVQSKYDPFGDYVVWLRNKSKLNFHNIPEVLHFYRERSDSLSSEALANRRNIIYEIQKPYYNNSLINEFNLTEIEELAARGWREYLYGDINKSLIYWRRMNYNIFKYPSILAATTIRMLPGRFFRKLYGKRIPNRLEFILKYFSTFQRKVIKDFNKTFNAIECSQ